ncbi:MAG: PA4642 family protein [Bermanella sp.]
MLKKDKEKVFGGEWNEESMRGFLTSKSHDGSSVDYLNIMKAYQHMLADTFAEFIVFFKEEGGDVNAKNLDNATALAVISTHTSGQAYADALKAAGAE